MHSIERWERQKEVDRLVEEGRRKRALAESVEALSLAADIVESTTGENAGIVSRLRELRDERRASAGADPDIAAGLRETIVEEVAA